METKVCYVLNDQEADVLEKVSKITGTDFHARGQLIEVEALMEAIEDMVVEYEELQEEYGDLEERYQDKYYGMPDAYDKMIDDKLTGE